MTLSAGRGDAPTREARGRRELTAASKTGLEFLGLRFAGAGGWALIAHILARNGPEGGVSFLLVMARGRKRSAEKRHYAVPNW
jgi:hypothetical protein